MNLESDRFVRVEDLGDHNGVVMRHQWITSITPFGLQPGEFRLPGIGDLCTRIAYLKRHGLPTDQSEAALQALEIANKEER